MPNNSRNGASVPPVARCLVIFCSGGAPIALAAICQAGSYEGALASCRERLFQQHQFSDAAFVFSPFRRICRLRQSHFSGSQSFGNTRYALCNVSGLFFFLHASVHALTLQMMMQAPIGSSSKNSSATAGMPMLLLSCPITVVRMRSCSCRASILLS